MYSGAGVDWAAIRPGVKLSDYKIKVGKFRDLTGNAPPEVYKHLNYTLQEEMDGIAGGAGNLSTQSAIYFATKGIGIEMIFRDSSGRVVAKMRHLIRGKPGNAAEEMVEAVTDFVEDHPVQ